MGSKCFHRMRKVSIPVDLRSWEISHLERVFFFLSWRNFRNFFVRKQTGKVKKLKKCLLDLLRGWWKWTRMQCDNNTCNIPISLRFLSSDCTCSWLNFTQPSVCPHYHEMRKCYQIWSIICFARYLSWQYFDWPSTVCGLQRKEFRCCCAFCQRRTHQLTRDCQFRLPERALQKRQYNFIIRRNVSKPQTYKQFNCRMLLQWKEDGISWPCLL